MVCPNDSTIDYSSGDGSTVLVVGNLYQFMLQDPATGLYYERARSYSPVLGAWISQDPLSYVNGANTYHFVMSNPVGRVDPSGRVVYLEEPEGGGAGLEGDSDPGDVLDIGGYQWPGGVGGGGSPSEGTVNPGAVRTPVQAENNAALNAAASSGSYGISEPWSDGPYGPMFNPSYRFPKVRCGPRVASPPAAQARHAYPVPGVLSNPPGPGVRWGFW